MSATSRSYGQQCGLAASLDLLGERWTLLILRELARGPKRFRDLIDNLEGIGTNLLSARLKSLEAAGVINRVTLPAPAAVAAYDLGDRGRSLLPILEELALWGFDLLESYRPDTLKSRAAWAAMTMQARMDRSNSPAPDGIYAFEVGGESFWLRVAGGESALRDGIPPIEPDSELRTDKDGFLALATGAASLHSSGDGVEVEGDGRRLEALLETFRLPPLSNTQTG